MFSFEKIKTETLFYFKHVSKKTTENFCHMYVVSLIVKFNIWSFKMNTNSYCICEYPPFLPFFIGQIIDTIVMNPPFGTRRKGADMDFLAISLKVLVFFFIMVNWSCVLFCLFQFVLLL